MGKMPMADLPFVIVFPPFHQLTVPADTKAGQLFQNPDCLLSQVGLLSKDPLALQKLDQNIPQDCRVHGGAHAEPPRSFHFS